MKRLLACAGVTLAVLAIGLLVTAQVDLIPFRAGEVIRAEEVNQNFQRLAEALQASQLPLTCAPGEVVEWDGSSWACAPDDVGEGGGGGDITAVTAGEGLTGGGDAGEVSLAAAFDGSGSATTIARSDHDHMGQTWQGQGPLILEAAAPSSTTTGGVLVLRNTGTGLGAGLLVSESNSFGLWVRAADDTGLVIDAAGRNGIFAFADEYGAELVGRRAGLIAKGYPSTPADVVPDLILGSNSCSPCGAEDDDGRLYSDPLRSSSDLFFLSNDAVVVQLDADGDEEGHFQVQNQSGAAVFQVAENGEVRVSGNVVHSSDRNLKGNLTAVDPQLILERLADLPIQRWTFLEDASGTPHLGPMAQEFNAAFDLGSDPRYISATDADGVALAAIQGLYALVLERDARIAALEARLERLETKSQPVAWWSEAP